MAPSGAAEGCGGVRRRAGVPPFTADEVCRAARPILGRVEYFGIEDLVPLADLGPPLSDALRTRLERNVADTRRLLAEDEAALDRRRGMLRAAG